MAGEATGGVDAPSSETDGLIDPTSVITTSTTKARSRLSLTDNLALELPVQPRTNRNRLVASDVVARRFSQHAYRAESLMGATDGEQETQTPRW